MHDNGIDPSREDGAIDDAACTNHAAFALLYEKYIVQLYRWMYRETGDPDLAVDLTAQVFVQAVSNA